MEAPPSATVQVDFSLGVGTGRFDASIAVPAADVTLTQMLPVLQELSSGIIGSAIRLVNDEGHAISCRAGCAACCRQLIPLSLFEAEALAEWILSRPLSEQIALEARFSAVLAALQEGGVLERMGSSLGRERDEMVLAIDYLALKIPCPFLVDELCGIHPIRPLICREYLVTSPPEFCASPKDYPVAGLRLPLKLSKVLVKIGAQLEHEGQGWIPLVFLFAWLRSGFRPGDAVQGPGPEILYEIVSRLTGD